MSQTKNMWNYHANNTKYPKTEIEIEISVYIYIYFVLAKCEGFQISAEGCGCRMCPKTRRTTKLTRYLLSLSHLTFDGKCRENVWCCLFHLTFALVWTRRVPHDNRARTITKHTTHVLLLAVYVRSNIWIRSFHTVPSTQFSVATQSMWNIQRLL